MHELNALAVAVFEQNKAVGWWDDMDRCVYQTLQLVSTEIAEATEGERKNLMDDKLPHRKMGEVELADAIIRLLDMAGRYGWQILHQDYVAITFDIPKAIGGQHYFLTERLVDLGRAIRRSEYDAEIWDDYSFLVATILEVGKRQGYDVMGAVYEKLEYNKTRADHKRENRAAEHGKKF